MKKEQKHQLHKLYVELVKLQKEIIASDLKILVILEGGDAAGKDGTIKRILKHLSPREAKVVALGKPSDKEKDEWYFQRHITHLPSAGEFVLFNRSWYNRAGVEKVMGFCSEKEYEHFFNDVPLFEKLLANSGIVLVKYYLTISRQEQAKRLKDRQTDPLKQWKISPIDEKAAEMWGEYSLARDHMLKHTNFKYAPWYIADAENKDDVHIALITHLLNQVDYKHKDKKLLAQKQGLIHAATAKNIKDKLYT
jgi:polyphosphate kinase 2